jgi:hypothetical protein
MRPAWYESVGNALILINCYKSVVFFILSSSFREVLKSSTFAAYTDFFGMYSSSTGGVAMSCSIARLYLSLFAVASSRMIPAQVPLPLR